MGYRPYRGPVSTLGQAMSADMPVQVVCQKCGHFNQLHAFTLVQQIGKKAEAISLPLSVPIDYLFHCRGCRARVPAMIIAPAEYA